MSLSDSSFRETLRKSSRLPGIGSPGSREAAVQRALAQAESPAGQSVYTRLFAQEALKQAQTVDALVQRGGEPPSVLAGWPVSIKDLFDVAGEPTVAGSQIRRTAPPALSDAPAVMALRRAGAAIVGKTNMSEFAFSGVGINPHWGTPRNPADAKVGRVPGGSSSGAAVSVALGGCVAALGSDTGGSLRIPAALCGIVGFKGTQSRVTRDGTFPLAPSLDTVGALTACVEDAACLDALLTGQPFRWPQAPQSLAGRRFLLPSTLMLDALEPAVAQAFERALAGLSAAGAQIIERPLPELAEVAHINAPAGLSPIEAYRIHADDWLHRRSLYDPRVAQRIALGETVSRAEYERILSRRQDWIARMGVALADVDALIAPTVPIVAPPIADLLYDDAAFFRANGLLLRNTFLINFLDGCAISLPCQAAGELPVGLMLAAPGGSDDRLLDLAWSVETALFGLGLGVDPAGPQGLAGELAGALA